MLRNYSQIALDYAQDVLDGAIPACKWVKAACQRHINDLQMEGTEEFPYWFESELADRVCRFTELLPHTKGEWAKGKTRIHLEPWQIFIICVVFGWINAQGFRRFRTVYIEVPRKNAKSTLTSAVQLYCLTADGEPGAEVYSAATTRDQAKITWDDARCMVEKTPGLRARFGVEVAAHSIFVPHTNSFFKALSRDQGGNLDGLNVHFGGIDELHAHKTREVFDVIETATGSRAQSLLWLITTAGFNRTGICYEQRAYAIKLLQKTEVDETYFGIIYTIDDEDDWTDPTVWQKANPNWNISVKPDDIERKARKAMAMPSATNNFLTKHLNVWVNADTAWMNMVAWDKCADPTLELAAFNGERCWVALDLATKTDIAACALLFKRNDKYYVFGRYYLPEEAAEDGRNQHYAGWARQDLVTLTPGSVTDFAYIERDLQNFAARFDIIEVPFDPWQATYLATRMMEEGLPMVEYRQTVQNMSEPMKMLEALVLDKKLIHDGSPVLTWMISNVVAHLDAKENIYPRKEFPQNKIDGVVALIMALGRAIVEENNSSVYEKGGILFI